MRAVVPEQTGRPLREAELADSERGSSRRTTPSTDCARDVRGAAVLVVSWSLAVPTDGRSARS
jgi:hypothetical protein